MIGVDEQLGVGAIAAEQRRDVQHLEIRLVDLRGLVADRLIARVPVRLALLRKVALLALRRTLNRRDQIGLQREYQMALDGSRGTRRFLDIARRAASDI